MSAAAQNHTVPPEVEKRNREEGAFAAADYWGKLIENRHATGPDRSYDRIRFLQKLRESKAAPIGTRPRP